MTEDHYWLEAILVIGSIVTFFTLIVMAFSGSLAGYFPFSTGHSAGLDGGHVLRIAWISVTTSRRDSFSPTSGTNFSWGWFRPRRWSPSR